MTARLGLLLAAALALPSIAQAANFDRRQHNYHPSAHHRMMYGHHNQYYHFYRHPDHHATATGGPAGGIPHRN